MFLVRESRRTDLDQILQVAEHLDSYNLPYDREAITQSLEVSADSFAGRIPVCDRSYIFVLEDHAAQTIVGTSMIEAQHGTRPSPHLYLDVLQDEHYSETLQRYMVHQALLIGYNYDGPTEIGGLILLPEYRGHRESLGRLLSYARFLFIASHRSLFRDEVLAELLPRLEDDGTSRLWKHFGKCFTGLTYREADRLSKHNKEFIRALFPQGLVYSCLFPQDVQDEIGEVGPETKGVEKMLTEIGFTYASQIDPFDGGPHFTAATDSITLVANAEHLQSLRWHRTENGGTKRSLIASGDADAQFRCTWSEVDPNEPGVPISSKTLDTLGLSEESDLWMVTP